MPGRNRNNIYEEKKKNSAEVNSLSIIWNCPTELFTKTEPRNPGIDVCQIQKVHPSPDFNALKLGKSWSGGEKTEKQNTRQIFFYVPNIKRWEI